MSMTKRDVSACFNNTPSGCKPSTMSLSSMVGMTESSEFLASYNKQFSPNFAKFGIMGMQAKLKKGRSLTLVLHKQTNKVTIVNGTTK